MLRGTKQTQAVMGTSIRLLGTETLTREQKHCHIEGCRAVPGEQPGMVVRELRNHNTAIL